jgi:hypothetical protein
MFSGSRQKYKPRERPGYRKGNIILKILKTQPKTVAVHKT